MVRRVLSIGLVLALGTCLLAVPVREPRVDPFEFFINPVLNKTIDGPDVKKVDNLPLDDLADFDRVLPSTTGTLLLIKTNQGRNAKLLVQAARQKVEGGKLIPVLLVDRYVTYKEGEERTILTKGEGLKLYPGFRFSLDLGQVVPAEVPGDIALVKDGDTVKIAALDMARMVLLTRYDKTIEPAKPPKAIIGEPFEPKYFNGEYKLYDDGRRSGKLTLKVDEEGNVVGAYYSDKDGARYELRGRVGNPSHTIQFTINFPRTEQVYNGWLFTGDGKALVGTSRILNRETGFYATRIEE
jgi:hypothetical protein